MFLFITVYNDVTKSFIFSPDKKLIIFLSLTAKGFAINAGCSLIEFSKSFSFSMFVLSINDYLCPSQH